MRSYASRLRLGSGVVLGIVAGVACSTALFPCAADGECEDGGMGGICQPEGVCSFPDDECPSGHRFGSHSGGLSNECVPEHDGTTGAAATSSTPASTDEGDPTLDVTSIDPVVTTSSSAGPLDATGEASTSIAEGTTDIEIDPALLLWFTFEDDTSDGLVNDGVLGGTAACTPDTCPLPMDEGAIGRAATFDGEDDCGVYPFVDELNATEFTLALWFRREVYVVGYDGVFTKPVGMGAYNTWRVYMAGPSKGADVLGIHVGLQDNAGVELEQELVLATWTHFAATWTGSALDVFIDGESIGALPSMLFEVDDHDVYVGCDDDVPVGITHFVHGSLDDVRMYSRVLDPMEITELFAQGTP